LLVVLFVCVVVALHLLLRVLDKEFCLTQLTMAIYYSIVVAALCLVMGYAGQVSLGHGAFFAIGGYTTAVLTTHDFSKLQNSGWALVLKKLHVFIAKEDLFGGQIMVVTPWAAFLAAVAVTLIISALIGYPVLRLKGHYLAMATLGFGLIVNKVLVGMPLFGSADGISGVPEWVLPGGLAITGKSGARVENYYFACAVTLVILVLLGNMVRSRVGRALQAIHDGETAANTIGINTSLYKLKVFVLSAILAAVAGVFFTHYTGGIGPSEASALKSVRYLALAATGGMANVWSASFVATGINFLSLRDWFGSYDNAVFGLILIVIISIAPDGPFKPLGLLIRRAFTRIARKPADADAPAKAQSYGEEHGAS
jgi:branched-chain amino acid transport system permease protein